MSQQAERSDLGVSLEGGIEALRQSSEFNGPVESLDGHECNEHLAQIYESDEERLEAAIPFVRHGLEQNERCLYVVDESSEAEVKAAMRGADIEVDAALDSGALSFHTVQDTYLRNGTFDPDEMIDFYAETVAEATEEYDALRIVAETTWLQEDATTVEQFMEYEAKVNSLFESEDCLALCQYDRDGFPSRIIREIVQTHPHLIYKGAVCQNVYYTPPDEFFGPDKPAREVDRMLGTLRERTEAKVKLEDRQRYLRKQNDVTASPDRTFEEKLQALFELGQDRYDLELGAMARVDVEADRFEVEYVSDDHEYFEPGVELPLSETYCTAATEIKAAGSVADPEAEGYDDIHVYEEFGIQAYLGTYIAVDGGPDRTFFFVTSDPRTTEFSADERAFLRSMGQWVKSELERRQREQFLRESYEITSNPSLPFEEKLERLLDLGCEWFGLEMAGLNHLPSWEGKFRLEKSVGLDVESEDEPLWTDPGEGCFCRQTVSEDAPVSHVDVRGTDCETDPIHQEVGLTSYLGTKVMSGSSPYGTLWFGSSEPADRPFSDTERTFIDLIGQWIGYEIERRDHQQSQHKLHEITADNSLSFDEKVSRVLDLGRDRFGLDMGFFLEKQGEEFGVVKTRGTELEEGVATLCANSGHYCKQTITVDVPVGVEDVESAGWGDDPLYREYDLGCYLGTRVTDGDGVYGSVCFADSSSREQEFTDAEYTFLDLIGQWLSYELERQQRERELRERTDHLNALVEATPECIKTVADDGTLLQMNPAGLDMVEADSESDVTGGCVYDLIAPEHRERFREFNERICQGEHGTLEFDVIGLEGTRRHMESHAAPLRRPDGTLSQVALTRDVTEQVEREAELERALDLLERTEGIADVGGWEIDPETMDVYWTEHLFELLEVRGDEEPPLDEALDLYHEDDRPIIESAIEEALDSGEPFDVEVRFRTPTGEVRWLRTQGVPETVDGETVSLRGAAQDVTEHKQREQRLERLIGRLEESNERLEQFAYAASHDLQEPLRMVSSYLQLLEGRYEEALDAEGEEFLRFAVDGADRMRAMIEGLLTYSRVERQGDPLKPVALDAVFDDVLSDLRLQIEESDADVTATELPHVEGDASQLRQVFQNLLENAIEYSGDERPRIRVSAERDGAEWIVSVRDEGIGIDPDDEDRIFEVFQRLHTHGEYDGTGIGLALCERIVERHGGDIWVDSEPGDGSTFSFTLPAVHGE